MADVFLSYAREDRATAERLAHALERRGRAVWWDRHVPAGKRFDEVIGENLASARCVVVLWSKAAIASQWVGEEAEAARERGLLMPALIDAVEPPLGFRRIQAADLVGWRGEDDHPGLRRLVVDIEALLAGESVGGAGAPSASPPAAAASSRRHCGRVALVAAAALAVIGIAAGLWWGLYGAPSATATVATTPAAGRWIDGRWHGTVAYGWGSEVRETFDFRVVAGTLTGSAGFLGQPRPIEEGTVDAENVHFIARWTETDGSNAREVINRYVGILTAEGGLNMTLSMTGGVTTHAPVTFALQRE